MKGVALILGAVAVGGALMLKPNSVADSTLPRGIRNNNPGNIRNNGTAWDGLAASQTDPTFYQFTAPVWGIRAMARILKNYRNSHGLTTVQGIISRWAPPSENNTPAYIAAVSKQMGVTPDTHIGGDATTQAKLIAAIIQHENGMQPYSMGLIQRGVNLA